MTSNTTVVPLRQPEAIDDALTAILRSGARRLLARPLRRKPRHSWRRCGSCGCRTGVSAWCGMVWDRSA